MANYRVKPGYCLHLPHGRFGHPGDDVELSGEVESAVLTNQAWKVEPVKEKKVPPEPEKKAPKGPPLDRAIKPEKTETR